MPRGRRGRADTWTVIMVQRDNGSKVYNLDSKGRIYPRLERNKRRPNRYTDQVPDATKKKDSAVNPSDDDEFFRVDED